MKFISIVFILSAVWWSCSTAAPLFQPATYFYVGPASAGCHQGAAIGDVDGNNLDDIVCATWYNLATRDMTTTYIFADPPSFSSTNYNSVTYGHVPYGGNFYGGPTMDVALYRDATFTPVEILKNTGSALETSPSDSIPSIGTNVGAYLVHIIHVADLDGDGADDLILPTYISGAPRWFKFNTGGPKVETPITTPTGRYEGITSGHVNPHQDDYIDLIVLCSADVYLLKGTDHGVWDAGTRLANGISNSLVKLSLEFIDNDHLPDLVILPADGDSSPNTLIFHRNTGTHPYLDTPTSSTPTHVKFDVFPGPATFFDINQDGALDLVSLRTDFRVALNSGSGSFTDVSLGASPFATGFSSKGNFFAPNQTDIIQVLNGPDSAIALRSNTLTFDNVTSPPTFLSLSSLPTSSPPPPLSLLAYADLDADGWLDLVTGNPVSGLIEVYSRGGNLDPIGDPLPSLTALAVADMDGDAALDVLAISSTSSLLSIYASSPSGGGWQASPLSFPSPFATLSGLAAVDATADGWVDIYLASSSGVALCTLDGALTPPRPLPCTTFDTTSRPQGPNTLLPTADADAAGLVYTTTPTPGNAPSATQIFVYTPSASPTPISLSTGSAAITAITLASPSSTIVVALATPPSYSVGYFTRTAPGVYSAMSSTSTSNSPSSQIHSLSVWDIDGDGMDDIFYSTSTAHGWALGPSFALLPPVSTALNNVTAAFVDEVSGDGYVDMVYLRQDPSNGLVSVHYSSGLGAYGLSPSAFWLATRTDLVPECGGVPGTLVCLTALVARSSVFTHLTLPLPSSPPPGGSRCATTRYPKLKSSLTLVGGILDCGTSGGGVLFDVSSGYDLTLDQVTIQGASSISTAPDLNAPLVVSDGSSLIIMDSVFRDCSHTVNGPGSVAGLGGVVHVDNSGRLSVTRSVFEGNAAEIGGGAVSLAGSNIHVRISHSSFVSNTVTSSRVGYTSAGGALSISSPSGSVTLTNCTFDANSALGGASGGALAILAQAGASIAFHNVSGSFNAAPEGGGGMLYVQAGQSTRDISLGSVSSSSALYGGALAFVSAVPQVFGVAPLSHLETGIISQTLSVSSLSDSSASLGGTLFTCGIQVVLDPALTTLSGTSTASDAGAFSFSCNPLLGLTAIYTGIALPALSLGPNGFGSPEASGPFAASVLAPIPQSSVSGTPLASGLIGVRDGFGSTITSNVFSISATPGPGAAILGTNSLSYSLAGGGFSLAPLAVSVSAGDWPALLDTSLTFQVLELTFSVVLTPCPRDFGRVSADVEDLICAACPAGSFSNNTSTLPCIPEVVCGEGSQFVDGACVLCGDNSVLQEVNVSLADSRQACFCERSFWSPQGVPNSPCVACPQGGSCPGRTDEPVALPGWFRLSRGVFGECPLEDKACVGNSVCAPGYTGDLCKDCLSGYHRVHTGECEACPSAATSLFAVFIVLFLLLVVFSVVLVGMAIRQAKDGRTQSSFVPRSVTTGLILFQVLGVLARSPFNWPEPPVQQILDAANVANINLSLFATACTVTSFNAQYTMQILLPALFVALAGLALVFVRTCGHLFPCCSVSRGEFPFSSTAIRVVVSFAPLVYIPLARTTLVFFDCTELADGNQYLDAEPSIRCGSSEWLSLLPLALAALLLYVIATPVAIACVLYRNRRRLDDPVVILRYGSAFHFYRKAYFYMDLVQLVKRLGFVMVSLFASSLEVYLFLGLFAVFVSSLAIHISRRPFLLPLHNDLEIRIDIAVIVVILTGVAFWADVHPNTTVFVITIILCVGAIATAIGALIWALAVEIASRSKIVPADGGGPRDNVFLHHLALEVQDLSPALRQAVEGVLHPSYTPGDGVVLATVVGNDRVKTYSTDSESAFDSSEPDDDSSSSLEDDGHNLRRGRRRGGSSESGSDGDEDEDEDGVSVHSRITTDDDRPRAARAKPLTRRGGPRRNSRASHNGNGNR